jgi:hypothetical protein
MRKGGGSVRMDIKTIESLDMPSGKCKGVVEVSHRRTSDEFRVPG